MKDLFHGYCKATIAIVNSELNPYDPIDGKASMVSELDKSEKYLINKPADLRTPDAVRQFNSRIDDQMI